MARIRIYTTRWCAYCVRAKALLASPLADAAIAGRSARDALRLVQASYEYHGGFRLKTLSG